MKKAKPATTALVILALTAIISFLTLILFLVFLKPVEVGLPAGFFLGALVWGGRLDGIA